MLRSSKLHVGNAFNSANWGWIKGTLAKLGVPGYFARIIEKYFSGRLFWYRTDNGSKKYIVTEGAAQDFVLGPLLWNMYDSARPLRAKRGNIDWFCDLAVVVVAKDQQDVELYASETIHPIKAWLQMVKLALVEGKAEMALITNRRRNNTVKIRVGNHEVVLKSIIRYLGVVIDAKLSFKGLLDYDREKAAKVSSSLAKTIPNIGGPKSSRRLLIVGVVKSILLYAAPVWMREE